MHILAISALACGGGPATSSAPTAEPSSATTAAPSSATTAAPTTIATYLAQPQPAPDATFAYGALPIQRVDVYLPPGAGAHPVVILLHGGCWTKELPGREQLRAVASELRGRGYAVWNIGYRRADEGGGGYPGTFQDVAAAIDALPEQAARDHLDLSRVVAVGHSAGAHLALWAASRGRLPRTSPLIAPHPFSLRAVIGLGSVGDLAHATGALPEACGAQILEAVVGAATAARPDVYADTSPAQLLPSGARTILITGAVDPITPPAYATTYADEVKAAGGSVELRIVPGAGHFDVVTVGTPAWRVVQEAIARALAPS
jgi:acetyl esterase/lipase